MFNYQRRHAPLRRSVTIDEVGGAALYLLSDLAGGVTGEVHYVDAGYHVVSMPRLEDLKADNARVEQRLATEETQAAE
jgi:enoyl-[acyl-carrier protein] reductase I